MNTIISPTVMTIFIFIFALLSFIFSASETSVIALSKIRLRHMLKKGVRHAPSVQRLVVKMDKFIAAILIGNNFVTIAMSALITAYFVDLLGYKWGVIIATLVSGTFILIICEVTPKILATKHTEKVALLVAPLMDILVNVFDPVVRLFIGISNFILKAFRVSTTKRSPLITEEELRLMIEVGKEEGVLSEEENKMLHRIFEFGDTLVKDVMVARDKIVAVNVNTSSDELLDVFVEEGHARLPVYEGSIDNIVGIIYARDLLYILRDKSLFMLSDLVHDIYRAPANMRVNELLRKFQSDKIQIALIIDERNKAIGLVTLEDLIEEIVGEIEEANIDYNHNSK
ncbi:MAG TPA: hemolysin family protein [Candidatus Margulisiibacteriota bacterium]|nr:hemolysin family protein [Candidatus Margulisiibacteriota bacterium]